MEDDLLETGAVLDALALCHEPGSYLPRRYQEDSRHPVPTASRSAASPRRTGPSSE